MIIDSLRQAWRTDGDAFEWTVPEGWMQGRAIFGGLSAAAAEALASRMTDRPLRTMQTQLLGPIAPGTVQGTCRLIREGKTTTFVEVRLTQNGTERANFVFVFVAARDGARTVDAPNAPSWIDPDKAIELPSIPGLTPEFTQHIEFRFAHGTLPFQGGDTAAFGGYIRFRDHKGALNVGHQLALLDAWPCPTLSVLDRPAFASTVTWTAHILAPSLAGGFHRFSYETIASQGGFSTALGHLWDAAGTYVGFTEQTVVVFD